MAGINTNNPAMQLPSIVVSPGSGSGINYTLYPSGSGSVPFDYSGATVISVTNNYPGWDATQLGTSTVLLTLKDGITVEYDQSIANPNFGAFISGRIFLNNNGTRTVIGRISYASAFVIMGMIFDPSLSNGTVAGLAYAFDYTPNNAQDLPGDYGNRLLRIDELVNSSVGSNFNSSWLIKENSTGRQRTYFGCMDVFFSPAYYSADDVDETPEDTDPYSRIDGESGIPGGGSVGIPSFPPLSATSTGIIGLFAPSPSQMQALADYMWTDFGGTGTDVTEVLKEIVEALKRAISNPLDYVIGLNIIPSQGLSIGGSSVIKFGFTSSGVSMPRLSNQYFAVDCGSIAFPPLCGDTFLDYAPYSKFSIYLPYIGVKDVDANDFVGHTIGVVYHGDTVTGGVTAYITKDGSVMYQYSGCCALNIPLSADNWGNTISGAVQIATSLVAGAATGSAAGVGIAAAKGAASVAANPSLLSPQVSHSGAVSGGAGCMAVQYPFVIREAVRFHSTAGFNKFSGYPSYYRRSLGAVSGFTTVLDVHLENVPATNGEIAEIENLLKSGVIL